LARVPCLLELLDLPQVGLHLLQHRLRLRLRPVESAWLCAEYWAT
jgi:hypothetical protein